MNIHISDLLKELDYWERRFDNSRNRDLKALDEINKIQKELKEIKKEIENHVV